MPSNFQLEAIGTKWRIDILQDISPEKENKILTAIKNRLEYFESAYSRFRPNSLVSRMSKSAGEYSLPEDAKPLLDFYKELYDLSSGLFTPMIGQVLSDAGYDSRYSLEKKKELSKPMKWDEVLTYKYPIVEIKKPTTLDFGGLGKGYAVDLVGGILVENSINSFCVDAGGDILYKTGKSGPIKIGLENPKNFDEVIGVAEISNKSLCGSSGSRRKWGKFHHIINPELLSSPEEVLSVWTVADSAIVADAMATCLFLVPPDKLRSQYDFEYVILYSDYSIKKSENFPAEFFIKNI